jgi:hypothetical protein
MVLQRKHTHTCDKDEYQNKFITIIISAAIMMKNGMDGKINRTDGLE